MNELVNTEDVATMETPEKTRTKDPERTMAEILAVAAREFAAKGLAVHGSTRSPTPPAPASG